MKKEKQLKFKDPNPSITFWIENTLSKERNYFLSDIRLVFQKWLLKKDIGWLKYYSCYDVVLFFISDKSGLNATHDVRYTNEIVRCLKPDYENVISGVNPVIKLEGYPLK